jgi:hypothetical protein
MKQEGAKEVNVTSVFQSTVYPRLKREQLLPYRHYRFKKIATLSKSVTLLFSKPLLHTLTPHAKRNELFTLLMTAHLP